MKAKVERINPYLNVSDVSESIKYYVDVLGFELSIKTQNLAIVEHDGHQINLRLNIDNSNPHRVWIGVDNIDTLWRQAKKNKAVFEEEPTNYSWAYQMMIKDPDGNLLIFASASSDKMPFED